MRVINHTTLKIFIVKHLYHSALFKGLSFFLALCILGLMTACQPSTQPSVTPNINQDSTSQPSSEPTDASTTSTGILVPTTQTTSQQTTTIQPTTTPSSIPETTTTVSPSPSQSTNLPVTSVIPLSIYKSPNLYYQISYPSMFYVDDSDPYTVIIQGDTGGIAILVDKLSVDVSPSEYFAAISAGKKQQLPTWTSSSIVEIKDNGVTIGYRYDYTNMVGDKNWIGKGLVFKKGGFGFYVVFTTPEANWKANEQLAVRCLDTFVLPKIATGAYSNTALGISLNLPNGWSLFETGSSQYPIVFAPAYNEHFVLGKVGIEAISPGTTAQQWIAALITKLGSTDDGRSQNVFSFANSTTGYEYNDSIAQNGAIVGKLRYIALASGNRIYYFMFVGTTTAMDSQTNTVTQLARSFNTSS